jgi:hypothetical protein
VRLVSASSAGHMKGKSELHLERGAGIGAGVGTAGGAIYQGSTKGKQVKIPAETRLDFQLEQPVTVTVMPRPSNSLVGQQ